MAKSKKKVIEDFQEEIKKKSPPNMIELFYGALKKKPDDLSEDEVRALIYRMSYLSDEERFNFRHILVRENLTTDEVERYQKLYTTSKFDKYFPSKDKVEEHYKVNFLQGRK